MSLSGRMVSFEVQGKSSSGYLAVPGGAGPWPGVVVIQEWWGLDNHIKSVADRLAGAGFVTIAPDLYNGQVTTEPDEARKLRMALVWDEALGVIQGAINFLGGRDQVSSMAAGEIKPVSINIPGR